MKDALRFSRGEASALRPFGLPRLVFALLVISVSAFAQTTNPPARPSDWEHPSGQYVVVMEEDATLPDHTVYRPERLDGFPRNTKQAEELDKMLAGLGMSLTAALSVDVPFEDLMKRLTGRRTCKACGQMFNIYFNAPKKEGVCDKCGKELFQRDDDKEETIKKRLEVYNAQTAPLMDYYGKKGLVKSVQGTGNIDDIFKKVCEVLGLK